MDKSSNLTDKKHFPDIMQFYQVISAVPKIHMVWGNIGLGKTTLALQMAGFALMNDRKVFYLHTKRTSISQIIQRILGSITGNKLENFNLWQINSLDEQKQLIFKLKHTFDQINQLYNLTGIEKRPIIFIDEISSLYLLDQGLNQGSDKSNHDLTFILATLSHISISYQIPIVLLNSFTVKFKEENPNDSSPRPFGGKILQYWTMNNPLSAGYEVKILRTPQVSRMSFSVLNQEIFENFQPHWTWLLSENGFK